MTAVMFAQLEFLPYQIGSVVHFLFFSKLMAFTVASQHLLRTEVTELSASIHFATIAPFPFARRPFSEHSECYLTMTPYCPALLVLTILSRRLLL